MKPIAATTALILAMALPATAEEDQERGFSLMEEGARLFFEGMMREMEPALDELQEMMDGLEPAMRDFAREMGPALRDLFEDVEDWSAYHPPEVMPNGDIVIRRKTPAERLPQPDEGGEIEL